MDNNGLLSQLTTSRTRFTYLTASSWNNLTININKYDLYILQKELNDTLADKLRLYRANLKLSRKGLSEILEVSPDTIKKWENNKMNISKKNYIKLKNNGII